MPAIAEPLQDLDLSLLDAYDFDHTPKCDVNGCDNNATHVLICKCGEGTEYICVECIVRTKIAASINKDFGKFTFDKSCLHETHINECQIREI